MEQIEFSEAAMTTITISLPESLKTFIEEQIATKGYGNVSEYFRTLLREAQAKEEDAKLEALLIEGLTSGEDIPISREFWSELKLEAAELARKHKTPKKKRDARHPAGRERRHHTPVPLLSDRSKLAGSGEPVRGGH
ncbi:MAG: ribbon-helix-helix domain-containing protein [Terriglobia bacterium]